MKKKRDLNTELCEAVRADNPNKVEQLLAEGADVNAIGNTVAKAAPLWLAVANAGQEISQSWADLTDGISEMFSSISKRDRAAKRRQQLRIIEMLLKARADLEKHCHGSVPLRGAVHGRDVEVVKLLLSKGANPNAETFSIMSKLVRKEGRKTLPGYYNTVLHEAVSKGSLPVAEALLAAGADPNRTDHEGKTPLTLAQEKGFKDLVTLLQGRTTLQSAQPSNVQPSDDVWRAATEGRLADLQQLIADGADVNARDAEKGTPLHKAAAAGQMPVAKWLVEHGANLNAKMCDRSTPLLLAASKGKTDLVKFLVLLKTDMDAAEHGGHTPFTAALIRGHIEIAEFLLRHGANPNHQIESLLNMTALMFVAGQKLLKTVEFLLKAGADATLCDARGQNALHHAVLGAVVHKVVDIGPRGELPEGAPKDALPIIERLLASGADPNARDDEGKTPLICARKLRLTKIISLLERVGEGRRYGPAC